MINHDKCIIINNISLHNINGDKYEDFKNYDCRAYFNTLCWFCLCSRKLY